MPVWVCQKRYHTIAFFTTSRSSLGAFLSFFIFFFFFFFLLQRNGPADCGPLPQPQRKESVRRRTARTTTASSRQLMPSDCLSATGQPRRKIFSINDGPCPTIWLENHNHECTHTQAGTHTDSLLVHVIQCMYLNRCIEVFT